MTFFAPGLFLFSTGIRGLLEAPARYWELEVAAVTSGLDFGAVFPLPVYALPRA